MLAGAALFTFACSPQQPQIPVQKTAQVLEQKTKQNLKERYGYEHVYLKSFYDLEFEKTDEIYEIPSDLESVIKGSSFFKSQTQISNKEKFENNVLKIAKDLGYAEDEIKILPAGEVLDLSARIVAENFSFKQINYEDKSIDEVFEIGKSKCTDYTYSVIAVFNMFKGINPNLKNVYVIGHKFCRYIGHAWNTVIVVGEEDVQIAYLDSTWYDTKSAEDLNATDKWHVDFERWKSQFYAELGDYCSAQQELKSLVEKTIDKKRLEDLLEDSARYYYWGKDYVNSLKVYNELVEKFPGSKQMDEYVYYVGWIYYELKDYEHAKECIETLRTKYSNSVYKLDYVEEQIRNIKLK